jgi:hypothetical protein
MLLSDTVRLCVLRGRWRLSALDESETQEEARSVATRSEQRFTERVLLKDPATGWRVYPHLGMVCLRGRLHRLLNADDLDPVYTSDAPAILQHLDRLKARSGTFFRTADLRLSRCDLAVNLPLLFDPRYLVNALTHAHESRGRQQGLASRNASEVCAARIENTQIMTTSTGRKLT